MCQKMKFVDWTSGILGTNRYVFCAVLRNFFPHRSIFIFYPLKIPYTNTSLVFISLRVHLQWNISIWLVCYLIRQANGSYQTRLYICNTLHSRQFCYHDFYVPIVSNGFSKVPNPDILLSLLLAVLVVFERKKQVSSCENLYYFFIAELINITPHQYKWTKQNRIQCMV